jgi:hypothetical protein
MGLPEDRLQITPVFGRFIRPPSKNLEPSAEIASEIRIIFAVK